ncbi:hypothetical protein BH10BAC5_BH10BAC5_17230 [soil metagenome]
MKKLSTIASRCQALIDSEGISVYIFCKLSGIPKNKINNVVNALTKGKPDEVSPWIIKKFYERYKDQITMVYLIYGEDQPEVENSLFTIAELKKQLKQKDEAVKSFEKITEEVEQYHKNKSKGSDHKPPKDSKERNKK